MPTEEHVIDGVLCWRNIPDGKWTRYTPRALTVALRAEREKSAEMERTARELNRIRARIERALHPSSWPMKGV